MQGAQGERRDLTQVRCHTPECLLLCYRPLTRLLSSHPHSTLARSIARNYIGDKGASALAAVLKETQITTLG